MIRNAQSGLLDYRAPMGSRVNLPHTPHFLSDSELRSLCSTIVTRFSATTGLSATRADPACPSRASGWGLSSGKGETLTQISKQHGVSAEEIQQLNKIEDAKKL
jgi:hypothetical protein